MCGVHSASRATRLEQHVPGWFIFLLHFAAPEIDPSHVGTNVEDDNPLQSRQGDLFAVAFENKPIVQVLATLVNQLFCPEHTVPHVVLHPRPALAWVVFTKVAEIHRHLHTQKSLSVTHAPARQLRSVCTRHSDRSTRDRGGVRVRVRVWLCVRARARVEGGRAQT
jgi:hypothetical protein